MPIYEYRCKECNHVFERLQGFNPPLPECPECGGEVDQLVSAPAVQFKGSGWYVTDYARKSSAPPVNGRSGEKKADSGKQGETTKTDSSTQGETTKTDSKPASKPSSGEKK